MENTYRISTLLSVNSILSMLSLLSAIMMLLFVVLLAAIFLKRKRILLDTTRLVKSLLMGQVTSRSWLLLDKSNRGEELKSRRIDVPKSKQGRRTWRPPVILRNTRCIRSNRIEIITLRRITANWVNLTYTCSEISLLL